MTKAEELAIKRAIENFVNREKRMCAGYSKSFPDRAEQRKREAALVIFGAEMALTEIEKALEEIK